MKASRERSVFVGGAALASAIFLSGCGTTSTRALPAYEPPIARNDFQTVRTTAYTHTESDHLEYTNHNALGGVLQPADPPRRRAETAIKMALESPNKLQPFSLDDDAKAPVRPVRRAEAVTVVTTTTTSRPAKMIRGRRLVVTHREPPPSPPRIGSAAADWSRWPAGTTFRLLSTGQIYRVDDYGWALAGRNTIDLYMATPAEMNAWGARAEPIEVLQWGDSAESLRRLAPHQGYKHIRRMVLELQGEAKAAARLQ